LPGRTTASEAATASPTQQQPVPSGVVRSTATVQAVRFLTIRAPSVTGLAAGQNGRLTLTRLIPNGRRVKQGDMLAELDQVQQLDDQREANAKLLELGHQLEEKRAQVRSDSAKRMAALKEAEADLAKARIQLSKGEVLAEIDRLQNEAKAESAVARVENLNKSHKLRNEAETAAVRVLELKVERQKVTIERIAKNLEKMTIVAPLDGLIAHENIWRNGTMGPPQEGDQVYPGMPLIRVFDPSEMLLVTQVNEPDIRTIAPNAKAKVYLDAYPKLVFDAVLESASPVATSGLESPVKTFTARFRIVQQDARLLPDLSAGLEISRAGSEP